MQSGGTIQYRSANRLESSIFDACGLHMAWQGTLCVSLSVDFEFAREGIPPQACLHIYIYKCANVDTLDREDEMPNGSR